MRYWIHEIAGWLLLAIGIYLLYACYSWLLDPYHILEAGALTVIGIIVFRGGLHLIKVAMAARVCLQAQEQAAASERAKTLARPARASARPTLQTRL